MGDRPPNSTRLQELLDLAATQGGIVTRAELYRRGVSRGEVRAHVRAARWQLIGRHCLALHTGPLDETSHLWAAVLEGGPRAFLDGESALIAAGLRNYTTERIRVSVPRGARIRHRASTYDIRQTRRWRAADVDRSGIPRSQPHVAAIRAALWARSDRQAALLLTMAVQQRLMTPERLAEELLHIKRDKRRAFLALVIIDLAGGVRSLGELDVLRGCRERGLPTPDLQVIRRTPDGIYYLDLRWSRWAVVVEVDGIQHSWAENVVSDAVRHNRITIDADTVLRLPVLGLRVCPDRFFDQIAEALRAKGWDKPVQRSA